MYEWQWLCFATEHEPQAVPRPLGQDIEAGLFAMEFLPPEDYPVWKSQLLQGHIDANVAAEVGKVLGRLHAASANRPELAAKFASIDNFRALRLEPYFLATAARHRQLTRRLHALAERTATTTIALVHGDVSPKNILVGPHGPVLLDAECAWYGDPAFDLAFCLNHLLLKSLLPSGRLSSLLQSFVQLAESYFAQGSFDLRPPIEARAAELLPALMLARIDGKSPVEYLCGRTKEQNIVRRFAAALLESPLHELTAVASIWSEELESL
jgi:aminoglycoside phosphotransferase (APT) family kinase protein